MKRFDVLAIGSGAGMHIVEGALMRGLTVALVEKGPLGGTCLNRGCIPSKLLIYPADVVTLIEHAEELGVRVRVESIDFRFIMERMRRLVGRDRSQMEEAVKHTKNLAFYNMAGEFVSDYTMRLASGETIAAENIFIASGAREDIPLIRGLEKVDYLTSENVWDLGEAPRSMIIIGGGLISVEMSHFFSCVGTKVTVVSRSPRLVKESEPEISELLVETMRKKMNVATGLEASEVRTEGSVKEVVAIDRKTGESHNFKAESIMIASGRRSNADILKPENTGVKLDERGYVRVNEYLETSKDRIWAFGDAIGKHMFRHVANYEAGVAWHNFTNDRKIPVDYTAVPYAIFGNPQIASVGLTEKEARGRGYSVLIGRAEYKDTAKGDAMGVEEGFVKAVVDGDTGRILGCHIIGPYAPEILQEVVNVMNCGDGSYLPILRSMHIHPATPEVVQNAFGSLHRHA